MNNILFEFKWIVSSNDDELECACTGYYGELGNDFWMAMDALLALSED